MTKLLTSILVILLSLTGALFLPVFSAEETYERKYIAVYNDGQNQVHFEDFLKSLKGLGRFELIPISSTNLSKTEFIEMVKALTNSNAKSLAEIDTIIDSKYKEVMLTKEDIEKLKQSTYLFIPEWKWGKVSIEDQTYNANNSNPTTYTKVIHLDLDFRVGIYTLNGLYHTYYSIKPIEVIDSVSIPKNYPSSSSQYYSNLLNSFKSKYNNPSVEEIAKAIELRNINKDFLNNLLTLEPFKLKSEVLAGKGIKLPIGGENVFMDQTFQAFVNKEVNGKTHKECVGILKARDVREYETYLQPVKTWDEITDGNQIVEVKGKSNNTTSVGLLSGKYSTPFEDKSGTALGIFGGFEFSMAKFTGVSELFFVGDADLRLNPNSPLMSATLDLGFVKKFFIDNIGLGLTFSGKVLTGVSTSNRFITKTTVDEGYSGVLPTGMPKDAQLIFGSAFKGASLSTGLEYILNENNSLFLDVGYEFIPIITWKASGNYIENGKAKEVKLDTSLMKDKITDTDISGLFIKFGVRFLY